MKFYTVAKFIGTIIVVGVIVIDCILMLQNKLNDNKEAASLWIMCGGGALILIALKMKTK